MSDRAPTERADSGSPTDQRRRRVLEAAGICFAEKGVQGTTMDEIAEGAGVSKPFIYKYFEGKDPLADAVIEEALSTWRKRTEAAAESETKVVDKIAAKTRASAGFTAERPVLRAILRQDRSLRTSHGRHFQRARGDNLEHTRTLLADGVRSGELDKDLDVDSMARMIEVLTHGLVQAILGLHVVGPTEGLVDAAVLLVQTGLKKKSRK